MYIFIIFMYCVWTVLILNDCCLVVLSGAMSASVWVVMSVPNRFVDVCDKTSTGSVLSFLTVVYFFIVGVICLFINLVSKISARCMLFASMNCVSSSLF